MLPSARCRFSFRPSASEEGCRAIAGSRFGANVDYLQCSAASESNPSLIDSVVEFHRELRLE